MLNPNEHLRDVLKQLKNANVPITGVFPATSETDAGAEIDGTYILQFAPYHTPQYLLDKVESPGEDYLSFSDVSKLIEYLIEGKNDESF